MPTKRERQLYSEQFATLAKQEPLSITFGNGGEISAIIQAAGLCLQVELKVSIVSPPARAKPEGLSNSGLKSSPGLTTVLHAAIPDSLTGLGEAKVVPIEQFTENLEPPNCMG